MKVIMMGARQEDDLRPQMLNGVRTIVVKFVGDHDRMPTPEDMLELQERTRHENPGCDVIIVPAGVSIMIDETGVTSRIVAAH